jgi:hypothetical protein
MAIFAFIFLSVFLLLSKRLFLFFAAQLGENQAAVMPPGQIGVKRREMSAKNAGARDGLSTHKTKPAPVLGAGVPLRAKGA